MSPASCICCSNGKIRPALFTLSLSSSTFLDTTVSDIEADNLYSVRTTGNRTTIWRAPLPWALSPRPTQVAALTWPQSHSTSKGKQAFHTHSSASDPVRVNIDGHIVNEDDILKWGILSPSRKFHVPDYPHSFKWKPSHGLFTLTANHHCPQSSLVAILDPPHSKSNPRPTPRLHIYPYILAVQPTVPVPQLEHRGASTILLDYILLTALLLVTHPEEWRTVKSAPYPTARRASNDQYMERSPSLRTSSAPASPTTPVSPPEYLHPLYSEPWHDGPSGASSSASSSFPPRSPTETSFVQSPTSYRENHLGLQLHSQPSPISPSTTLSPFTPTATTMTTMTTPSSTRRMLQLHVAPPSTPSSLSSHSHHLPTTSLAHQRSKSIDQYNGYTRQASPMMPLPPSAGGRYASYDELVLDEHQVGVAVESDEPPPPYEQIQFTVRVRPPRRMR